MPNFEISNKNRIILDFWYTNLGPTKGPAQAANNGVNPSKAAAAADRETQRRRIPIRELGGRRRVASTRWLPFLLPHLLLPCPFFTGCRRGTPTLCSLFAGRDISSFRL
jgi:hypothetical protein